MPRANARRQLRSAGGKSKTMVPAAGLEPTTSWFEARRSIQLSYAGGYYQCIGRGRTAQQEGLTPYSDKRSGAP